MIRINLLTERRKKKAFPLLTIIIPGAVITGLTFIVLLVFGFYLNSNVSEMRSNKAIKDKKVAELKEALKQVENYEKDNEAFKEKNSTIERLKSRQTMPVRLLDEVSAMLPNGVWLTRLTEKDGVVSILGYAFTNSDLVNYVQNLKGSKYLMDVVLLESKQKDIQKFSVYEFKLTFKI